MTLRQKLELEQMGEEVVLSERFERGVSIAASLMAHFAEEQAEIRLFVYDERGEYGVGSRHLHKLFKKLAVVEPVISSHRALEPVSVQVAEELEEADNSHNFLLTTRDAGNIPLEITRKCTVISL